MIADLREASKDEIESSESKNQSTRLTIVIENHCGRYAENKEDAIRIRDNRLLPAIETSKAIILDFSNVISAPHSFLTALLATPIRRLGLRAYKNIKVTNAAPEIRETIDYIMDENTPHE